MSNYENSKHSSPDIKFYDEYHHDKNKEKVMVSAGMHDYIRRKVDLDHIYLL